MQNITTRFLKNRTMSLTLSRHTEASLSDTLECAPDSGYTERCSIALTGGLSSVQTSFFSLAQPSKLDGKQAHQETSELDVRSASAFAVREEAGSCRTVTC